MPQQLFSAYQHHALTLNLILIRIGSCSPVYCHQGTTPGPRASLRPRPAWRTFIRRPAFLGCPLESRVPVDTTIVNVIYSFHYIVPQLHHYGCHSDYRHQHHDHQLRRQHHLHCLTISITISTTIIVIIIITIITMMMIC